MVNTHLLLVVVVAKEQLVLVVQGFALLLRAERTLDGRWKRSSVG